MRPLCTSARLIMMPSTSRITAVSGKDRALCGTRGGAAAGEEPVPDRQHPPGSHQHAGAERGVHLWPLQARKSASPGSGRCGASWAASTSTGMPLWCAAAMMSGRGGSQPVTWEAPVIASSRGAGRRVGRPDWPGPLAQCKAATIAAGSRIPGPTIVLDIGGARGLDADAPVQGRMPAADCIRARYRAWITPRALPDASWMQSRVITAPTFGCPRTHPWRPPPPP